MNFLIFLCYEDEIKTNIQLIKSIKKHALVSFDLIFFLEKMPFILIT